MAERSDPFRLLTRSGNHAQLLRFVRSLLEELDAAFANAVLTVPGPRSNRPAVQARGSVRRWLLDSAFRQAADRAGFEVTTGVTDPPSWSFPVARVGAFAVTLGIVDRKKDGYALRSRGAYLKRLAKRNNPLSKQGDLFRTRDDTLPRVIPDGAFGGMIVVECDPRRPETPAFAGFLVPSPSLRTAYYTIPLTTLMAQLRESVGAAKKQERRKVVRKKPILKKRRPQKDD